MGFLSGLEHCVREGEPLAPHTWFRFGGSAQYFAEPTSVADLTEIVKRCHNEGAPVRLLGGGSNVVVRDAGVEGVVVRLSAPVFSQMEVQGKRIQVGGGAKLGHLVSMCASQGLAGMEQLVGIPGAVGGALHGNAGSHVADIGQWTIGASVMTRSGEIITRSAGDLQFSYRDSSLDELVILDATLEFEEDDPQSLTQKMQQTWIVAKAKQPTIGQNAGCIFKDSGGVSASSLIEDAGLKGERIGEVAICDKNANFMIAEPGAQCDDLLKLIDLVRLRVSEQLGVDLELQIEIW